MTRPELREKLQKQFSSETWRELLPLLFPGAAFFQAPQDILADGEIAKSVRQTGFLPLGDDRRLGLFEVEIASEHTVIARNRVGLRALVAKLVDQATIHGALVLFYRQGSSDYRLSFITKQASFTAEGRLQVTETAPKRYTYVLGPGEPCTTAAHRLGELLNRSDRPTLESVAHAFSVASVTKEFYKAIEESHSDLKKYLEKLKHLDGFGDARIRAQFATRLLGRLVFLRFLAKKNIVPEAFFDPKASRDVTYYQKTLGPLFFETLNTPQDQRRASLPKEFAKIPYLNGGLFEPSPHDGWPNPAFFIPPGWFQSLFETFQAYNFTVDENSLQDVEIAVDPEMLGQIFENLLATESTDTGRSARDAHGTFYTPREVVDYLCRQSLRVRLSKLHPDLSEVQLDDLLALEPGSPMPGTVSKGRLLESLDSLKIFDPAVGSGAFPIGMLHVLAGAYEQLDDRYNAYKVKLRIIKNNLYGADIEPMAIELAKLRCWLSLMVETDTIKVPPLPNLDLKFFCLNTLFDPPELDGEDLFLQTGLKELDVLEQDFFDCNAKEKKAKRLAIGKKLDELYQSVRSQHIRQALKSGSAPRQQKDALSAAELLPESQTLFQDWLREGTHHLPFFPKELLCPEVFPLKGKRSGTLLDNSTLVNQLKGQQELTSKTNPRRGFDVIVANPPYVRHEGIKEFKPRLQIPYFCYKGTADLYVYFYERSVQLMKEGGVLAFISSNSFLNAEFGSLLRNYLTSHTELNILIDFAETKVFKAITEPLILIASKGSTLGGSVHVLKWNETEPVAEISTVFRNASFSIKHSEFGGDIWRIERPEVLELLQTIQNSTTTLGNYVEEHFYYGIKTGFNDAFVVGKEKRDDLIAQHRSSKELLKPFVRGRDVARWKVNFDDQYLIQIESSENKLHPWSGKTPSEAWKVFGNTFPAIQKFMSDLKKIELDEPDRRGCKNKFEQLQKRDDQGKYFWELRSCAYWDQFSRPKIVYQDIARYLGIAYDTSGAILGNTVYFIPDASKWLLALLLSSTMQFYISKTLGSETGGFIRLFTIHVSKFPVVIPHIEQRKLLENFVNMLGIKPVNPLLEGLLNGMVYELYFPNELHKANLKFFEMISKMEFPKVLDNKTIATFTHALSNPNLPVRRALFALGSLPIVRLIENQP